MGEERDVPDLEVLDGPTRLPAISVIAAPFPNFFIATSFGASLPRRVTRARKEWIRGRSAGGKTRGVLDELDRVPVRIEE